MWVEFVTEWCKDNTLGVRKEKAFIDIKEIVSIAQGKAENYVEEEDEHRDTPCLILSLRGGKSIDVLEKSYEEVIALVINIPKNSPYHRG